MVEESPQTAMLFRPFTAHKKASVLSFVYQSDPSGHVDQNQMNHLIKQSLAQGINTFGVDSQQEKQAAEVLLGTALKAAEVDRQSLILTSKISLPDALVDDASASYDGLELKVLSELQKSLENLQTDYIDLLFVEGNNQSAEAVLRALNSKGQVFAPVNWAAAATSQSRAVQSQSQNIFQINYSILERQEVEENFRGIVSKKNTRIFASNPLACNMLTANSQIDTDSLNWTLAKQVQGKLQEETFWKTKDIEKNAKEWNASLSQASVAWVAANSDVTSVQVNQVFLESEDNVKVVLDLLKSWSAEKEQVIRNAAKNEPEIQCDKSLTWAQYQKLQRRRDIAVKFSAQDEMEWEPSQATGGDAAAHGYDYDLFVIGGGSGGISSARWAGNLGKKVAVADFVQPSPAGTKWGLGGTCVNVGCIPKKLMHYASLLNESKEEMKNAGVSVSEEPHSWNTMVTTVTKHIKTLNWGYKTELIKAGCKYFNMYAKLVDAHTIHLDDGKKQQTVTADKIIIACGGRPTYPDIPGAKEFGISSDDIFWKKEAPGKTLVVGASYVALECAGFLHGIGFDVTVMVRSILLRGFDQDMANLIGTHMEANGTKFIRSAVPEKLEKNEAGKIIVTYAQEGESKQEEYDTVLFAIGRTACTAGIELQNAGIKAESNGKIKVNEKEQTNIENIYAIGDVIYGNLELTPVAIKAGKLLAHRLFGGKDDLMDYVGVPTTVFTPLEYGCCGLSEEEAIKKYGDANIDVFHQKFKPLEWTYNKKRVGGDGYVKVIVNHLDNERIVGFHVLAPNAGDITQGVGIAMKGPHFNKEQLDSCVGIHPTVAEDIIGLEKTKREEPDASKGSC